MNDQTTNPEIEQDRVFDTVDHFKKFGCIMFKQQVAIYENIAQRIKGKEVIEAGCGNGLGTAILNRQCPEILGTDKLGNNIQFAKCLYPWIHFSVWDINKPSIFPKPQIVVCVETIEHVADPQKAIENLMAAATEEVWISTPNGTGEKRPPENPYHVCEYTPEEMFYMFGFATGRPHTAMECPQMFHWKTMEQVYVGTKIDPLVYRIQL